MGTEIFFCTLFFQVYKNSCKYDEKYIVIVYEFVFFLLESYRLDSLKVTRMVVI